MKGLNTLIEDVYEVLRHPHTPSEENLDAMMVSIKEAVKNKLEATNIWEHTLRPSAIGKPDRLLYYQLSGNYEAPAEEIDPATKIKFLFGDIWEPILIFLMKEAGHTVTNEQQEVSIGGLVGHKDCDIDGVTSDIKSASSYSFQNKFEKGNLTYDDPFGYIAQLSAYVQGSSEDPDQEDSRRLTISSNGVEQGGAFVAVDKSSGELAVLMLDSLEMIDAEERIEHIRDMLKSDQMPERCYEPVAYGKSGNMKLPTNCGYCSFKEDCWKTANDGAGIRRYQYKRNIVSFVSVTREPNNAKEVM